MMDPDLENQYLDRGKGTPVHAVTTMKKYLQFIADLLLLN
jgi:hypothetical protein